MAALMVFIVFLIAIAVSVPIGVAMCLGTLFPQYFMNAGAPVDQLINFTLSGADSTPILAVPLFILGGVIMAEGGISRRLFNFFSYFVGNIPGGVPCAAILTCLFYGAISGSGPATTAAVGSMCIPFMVEMGYEKRWSAGLIAVAGGLGVIIPPSIPFVLYSLATGVSTGDLFLAGVIPGILIGVSLCLYTTFYCKKHKYINKDALPFSWGNVGRTLKDGVWALLVPVIILGGIYGGIFTPTEAAAVAVAYGLVVGLFVYRDLKLKDLYRIFANAALTTATILIILGTATTFGRILTLERVPMLIADFFESATDSRVVLLMLINILLLFVGCFMDTNAAIIILAPIFLPIVEAMDVDPIHFGIIMVVNLAIGFVTPPLGVNLFVACNVANAKLEEICKGIFPIVGVMILDLLLITYIEPLSMILPNLMY